MKKNVTILIHSNYNPFNNIGGIQTVVKDLIDTLQLSGFEIICFCGGDVNKVYIKDKVTIVQRKILFKIGGCCFLSFGNTQFLRSLKKASLIIYQEPYPTLWPSIFLIKLIRATKVIFLVHSGVKANKFVTFLYDLTRSILVGNSSVVVTAPQNKKYIGFINSRQITIIPLGITLPSKTIKQNVKLSKPYGLCIGRIARYKGLDILISACEKLNGRQILIVGDGPLAKDLHKKVLNNSTKNVKFINKQVSEFTKEALLRNCEFFIFPSTEINEAFGIMQLEAMAHRKAIINTFLDSGVNYVAQDGKNALTVKPSCSSSLAKGMILLFENNKLRNELGRQGFERLRDKFSLQKFKTHWISLVGKELYKK